MGGGGLRDRVDWETAWIGKGLEDKVDGDGWIGRQSAWALGRGRPHPYGGGQGPRSSFFLLFSSRGYKQRII